MYGEIFLPDGHVCGLKWVNVHPENPKLGLLTVMAKVVLNDPETGLEWADMDGTFITNYRTGASGGVAANTRLRSQLTRLGAELAVPVLLPPPALTTDNAVMIARAGQLAYARGRRDDPRRLDAFTRQAWQPPGMRR